MAQWKDQLLQTEDIWKENHLDVEFRNHRHSTYHQLVQLVFDHLAIAAESLDQGRNWSSKIFGEPLPDGGAHPRMGTHNLLTACSQSEFVEIISIDPDEKAPDRPRWFGLDHPETIARLITGPSLEGWAAGTPDIHASIAAAHSAGIDLGEPVEMTRGDLTWLISIRPDGALPEFGCLPFLIQWPYNADPAVPHPASRMTDIGLRIDALTLHHPEPDRLRTILEVLEAGHLIDGYKKAAPETSGPTVAIRRPDNNAVTIQRQNSGGA